MLSALGLSMTKKFLICVAALALFSAVTGCDDNDPEPTNDAGVLDATSDSTTGTTPIHPSRLSEDDISRVAVLLNSCDFLTNSPVVDDGLFRTTTGLRNQLGDVISYMPIVNNLECFKGANNCADIDACLSIERLENVPPEECDTCDGNKYTKCAPTPFRFDCTTLGATCMDGQGCKETLKNRCGSASCGDNETAILCEDDASLTFKCGDFGLTCGDDISVCHGTGNTCDNHSLNFIVDYTEGGIRCDGDNSLVSCIGGKEATFDCATVAPGFSCQRVDGHSFCGQAAECKANAIATCDGDAINFCQAGKNVSVDCRTLGFTTCVDGAKPHCE